MKLEIREKPDGEIGLTLELGDMGCEINARFIERQGMLVALGKPYSTDRVERCYMVGSYGTLDVEELPEPRCGAVERVRDLAWQYLKDALPVLRQQEAETPPASLLDPIVATEVPDAN